MYAKAQDSLVSLRHARKRLCPADGKSLPLDDLRALVAAKRRRLSSNGTVAGRKNVCFNLAENVVNERYMPVEDLQRAWMSNEESAQLKERLLLTVHACRKGYVDDVECLRGLEVHSNPVRMQEKITRGRSHVHLILQQQRLLKSAGKSVMDPMMSQLASVLSAADADEARQAACMDAKEAYLIHARDKAEQDKQREIQHTIQLQRQQHLSDAFEHLEYATKVALT